MTELIVFDWDGTLMDSEGRIVACLQQAARDLGHEVPPPGRAREVIGLGLHQAVARLFPEVDEAEVQRLSDAYRRHFLGDELAHSELFPGARELLEELAGAGYLLAVATGKSRRGLEKEFERTGLGDLFYVSRCADETFSKPNPRMLLEILDDTGREPERALVVGDTEFDMLMAANARTPAVGVSHGVHSPERLRQAGALEVFHRLEELPGWLQ
jgi:phosphoglycolate phosphatase